MSQEAESGESDTSLLLWKLQVKLDKFRNHLETHIREKMLKVSYENVSNNFDQLRKEYDSQVLFSEKVYAELMPSPYLLSRTKLIML